MENEELEVIIDNYRFSVDHFTVYDSYSSVKVEFVFIPIGYFCSEIEEVSGKTIRDLYELEAYAREWIAERESFRD